jgi:CIC family chloride channel protein
MVMELTGSYGLLVPSLLVATIAYLLTPPKTKLYENQLASRTESPAHLGSFALDILRRSRVRDRWKPEGRDEVRAVSEAANLESLMELAADSKQNVFPVTNKDGVLVGELSIEDVRRALISEEPKESITVRSLMKKVIGPLLPGDDLARAAQLLASRQADSVIVVQSRERPEILGLFTRHDLVVAYSRHFESADQERADGPPRIEPF